jgi:phosphatidate cytidylyltransferase
LARSNLAVRALTGLIGAPAIVALLFLGPERGWLVFVALATLVAANELFSMTHPEDGVARTAAVALTLSFELTLYFFSSNPRALVTLVLLTPLAALILALIRLGNIQSSALRFAATVFGPLYLGGGMGALALMRRDAGTDGPSYVLLSLVLAWAADTGAYFAGRFFGKHKLYEAVSPKKTVEGAIGGLVANVLGAALLQKTLLPSLPLAHALGLAVVAGGLGQAGDLGESLLKRSVGVKDSGGIIPGHGGLLDRVDALLVTGTLTYLYVLWTHG